MLRKETVSNELLKALNSLMELKILHNHRLVGGTSLALQLGHRISVDIDLFSDQDNDADIIISELEKCFGKEFSVIHKINSPLGKGFSSLIYRVKTDILDWKNKFNFEPIYIDNIRFARKEDMVGLKLNTFLCDPIYARYNKKDFTDLAVLLNDFNIARMIELYKLKFPLWTYPDRIVLEGISLSELADKKTFPKMLNGLTWTDVKKKLEHAVVEYLKSR